MSSSTEHDALIHKVKEEVLLLQKEAMEVYSLIHDPKFTSHIITSPSSLSKILASLNVLRYSLELIHKLPMKDQESLSYLVNNSCKLIYDLSQPFLYNSSSNYVIDYLLFASFSMEYIINLCTVHHIQFRMKLYSSIIYAILLQKDKDKKEIITEVETIWNFLNKILIELREHEELDEPIPQNTLQILFTCFEDLYVLKFIINFYKLENLNELKLKKEYNLFEKNLILNNYINEIIKNSNLSYKILFNTSTYYYSNEALELRFLNNIIKETSRFHFLFTSNPTEDSLSRSVILSNSFINLLNNYINDNKKLNDIFLIETLYQIIYSIVLESNQIILNIQPLINVIKNSYAEFPFENKETENNENSENNENNEKKSKNLSNSNSITLESNNYSLFFSSILITSSELQARIELISSVYPLLHREKSDGNYSKELLIEISTRLHHILSYTYSYTVTSFYGNLACLLFNRCLFIPIQNLLSDLNSSDSYVLTPNSINSSISTTSFPFLMKYSNSSNSSLSLIIEEGKTPLDVLRKYIPLLISLSSVLLINNTNDDPILIYGINLLTCRILYTLEEYRKASSLLSNVLYHINDYRSYKNNLLLHTPYNFPDFLSLFQGSMTTRANSLSWYLSFKRLGAHSNGGYSSFGQLSEYDRIDQALNEYHLDFLSLYYRVEIRYCYNNTVERLYQASLSKKKNEKMKKLNENNEKNNIKSLINIEKLPIIKSLKNLCSKNDYKLAILYIEMIKIEQDTNRREYYSNETKKFLYNIDDKEINLLKGLPNYFKRDGLNLNNNSSSNSSSTTTEKNLVSNDLSPPIIVARNHKYVYLLPSMVAQILSTNVIGDSSSSPSTSISVTAQAKKNNSIVKYIRIFAKEKGSGTNVSVYNTHLPGCNKKIYIDKILKNSKKLDDNNDENNKKLLKSRKDMKNLYDNLFVVGPLKEGESYVFATGCYNEKNELINDELSETSLPVEPLNSLSSTILWSLFATEADKNLFKLLAIEGAYHVCRRFLLPSPSNSLIMSIENQNKNKNKLNLLINSSFSSSSNNSSNSVVSSTNKNFSLTTSSNLFLDINYSICSFSIEISSNVLLKSFIKSYLIYDKLYYKEFFLINSLYYTNISKKLYYKNLLESFNRSIKVIEIITSKKKQSLTIELLLYSLSLLDEFFQYDALIYAKQLFGSVLVLILSLKNYPKNDWNDLEHKIYYKLIAYAIQLSVLASDIQPLFHVLKDFYNEYLLRKSSPNSTPPPAVKNEKGKGKGKDDKKVEVEVKKEDEIKETDEEFYFNLPPEEVYDFISSLIDTASSYLGKKLVDTLMNDLKSIFNIQEEKLRKKNINDEKLKVKNKNFSFFWNITPLHRKILLSGLACEFSTPTFLTSNLLIASPSSSSLVIPEGEELLLLDIINKPSNNYSDYLKCLVDMSKELIDNNQQNQLYNLYINLPICIDFLSIYIQKLLQKFSLDSSFLFVTLASIIEKKSSSDADPKAKKAPPKKGEVQAEPAPSIDWKEIKENYRKIDEDLEELLEKLDEDFDRYDEERMKVKHEYNEKVNKILEKKEILLQFNYLSEIFYYLSLACPSDIYQNYFVSSLYSTNMNLLPQYHQVVEEINEENNEINKSSKFLLIPSSSTSTTSSSTLTSSNTLYLLLNSLIFSSKASQSFNSLDLLIQMNNYFIKEYINPIDIVKKYSDLKDLFFYSLTSVISSLEQIRFYQVLINSPEGILLASSAPFSTEVTFSSTSTSNVAATTNGTLSISSPYIYHDLLERFNLINPFLYLPEALAKDLIIEDLNPYYIKNLQDVLTQLVDPLILIFQINWLFNHHNDELVELFYKLISVYYFNLSRSSSSTWKLIDSLSSIIINIQEKIINKSSNILKQSEKTLNDFVENYQNELNKKRKKKLRVARLEKDEDELEYERNLEELSNINNRNSSILSKNNQELVQLNDSLNLILTYPLHSALDYYYKGKIIFSNFYNKLIYESKNFFNCKKIKNNDENNENNDENSDENNEKILINSLIITINNLQYYVTKLREKKERVLLVKTLFNISKLMIHFSLFNQLQSCLYDLIDGFFNKLDSVLYYEDALNEISSILYQKNNLISNYIPLNASSTSPSSSTTLIYSSSLVSVIPHVITSLGYLIRYTTNNNHNLKLRYSLIASELSLKLYEENLSHPLKKHGFATYNLTYLHNNNKNFFSKYIINDLVSSLYEIILLLINEEQALETLSLICLGEYLCRFYLNNPLKWIEFRSLRIISLIQLNYFAEAYSMSIEIFVIILDIIKKNTSKNNFIYGNYHELKKNYSIYLEKSLHYYEAEENGLKFYGKPAFFNSYVPPQEEKKAPDATPAKGKSDKGAAQTAAPTPSAPDNTEAIKYMSQFPEELTSFLNELKINIPYEELSESLKEEYERKVNEMNAELATKNKGKKGSVSLDPNDKTSFLPTLPLFPSSISSIFYIISTDWLLKLATFSNSFAIVNQLDTLSQPLELAQDLLKKSEERLYYYTDLINADDYSLRHVDEAYSKRMSENKNVESDSKTDDKVEKKGGKETGKNNQLNNLLSDEEKEKNKQRIINYFNILLTDNKSIYLFYYYFRLKFSLLFSLNKYNEGLFYANKLKYILKNKLLLNASSSIAAATSTSSSESPSYKIFANLKDYLTLLWFFTRENLSNIFFIQNNFLSSLNELNVALNECEISKNFSLSYRKMLYIYALIYSKQGYYNESILICNKLINIFNHLKIKDYLFIDINLLKVSNLREIIRHSKINKELCLKYIEMYQILTKIREDMYILHKNFGGYESDSNLSISLPYQGKVISDHSYFTDILYSLTTYNTNDLLLDVYPLNLPKKSRNNDTENIDNEEEQDENQKDKVKEINEDKKLKKKEKDEINDENLIDLLTKYNEKFSLGDDINNLLYRLVNNISIRQGYHYTHDHFSPSTNPTTSTTTASSNATSTAPTSTVSSPYSFLVNLYLKSTRYLIKYHVNLLIFYDDLIQINFMSLLKKFFDNNELLLLQDNNELMYFKPNYLYMIMFIIAEETIKLTSQTIYLSTDLRSNLFYYLIKSRLNYPISSLSWPRLIGIPPGEDNLTRERDSMKKFSLKTCYEIIQGGLSILFNTQTTFLSDIGRSLSLLGVDLCCNNQLYEELQESNGNNEQTLKSNINLPSQFFLLAASFSKQSQALSHGCLALGDGDPEIGLGNRDSGVQGLFALPSSSEEPLHEDIINLLDGCFQSSTSPVLSSKMLTSSPVSTSKKGKDSKSKTKDDNSSSLEKNYSLRDALLFFSSLLHEKNGLLLLNYENNLLYKMNSLLIKSSEKYRQHLQLPSVPSLQETVSIPINSISCLWNYSIAPEGWSNKYKQDKDDNKEEMNSIFLKSSQKKRNFDELYGIYSHVQYYLLLGDLSAAPPAPASPVKAASKKGEVAPTTLSSANPTLNKILLMRSEVKYIEKNFRVLRKRFENLINEAKKNSPELSTPITTKNPPPSKNAPPPTKKSFLTSLSSYSSLDFNFLLEEYATYLIVFFFLLRTGEINEDLWLIKWNRNENYTAEIVENEEDLIKIICLNENITFTLPFNLTILSCFASIFTQEQEQLFLISNPLCAFLRYSLGYSKEFTLENKE